MSRKLPPDSFSYYLALGEERSYDAVAEHFGASKRAVGKLAKRERWQERIEAIEKEARERFHEKAVDSLEEMNTRHLRTLRVIQAKALETLQATRLENPMDAIRALALAIKTERVICGEPSERHATNLEEILRAKYFSLLEVVDAEIVDRGGDCDRDTQEEDEEGGAGDSPKALPGTGGPS